MYCVDFVENTVWKFWQHLLITSAIFASWPTLDGHDGMLLLNCVLKYFVYFKFSFTSVLIHPKLKKCSICLHWYCRVLLLWLAVRMHPSECVGDVSSTAWFCWNTMWWTKILLAIHNCILGSKIIVGYSLYLLLSYSIDIVWLVWSFFMVACSSRMHCLRYYTLWCLTTCHPFYFAPAL